MKNFELQTTAQFVKDFLKEAKKAKKRIWIQTMFFEACKQTKPFEDVLIKASKKKLDVQLVIDWSGRRYAREKVNLYPFFPIKKRKRDKMRLISKQNKEMLKRFVDCGVKLLFANSPSIKNNLIPILRRSHSKIFVVDDMVWTGGINLSNVAFSDIDFMIKFKNRNILKAIEKQFPHVTKKPVRDYLIDLNTKYKLLVDNGRYNESIIYNQALKMIDQATKEIIFVSQYLPDGLLLRKLIKKAKDNVNIIIMSSYKEHKVFTKFPYTTLFKNFTTRTKKINNIKLVHCSKRVHAKLLQIDKKEAIFGSHNFTTTTVLVGTQEISIHSKDRKLVKALDKFATKLYKKSLR